MELNRKLAASLDLAAASAGGRYRKVESVGQILWLQNNQIPPFYVEALQYVTCTGQGVDTNLLFPLLVYSRLPQDILGQIWGVCNQTFPGQLTFHEFFAALALVAVRQQNGSTSISLQSIADFPCVPNFFDFDFSQRPTPPDNVHSPDQLSSVQAQVQATNVHSVATFPPNGHNIPTEASTTVNNDVENDEDEFGDFTEAIGELPLPTKTLPQNTIDMNPPQSSFSSKAQNFAQIPEPEVEPVPTQTSGDIYAAIRDLQVSVEPDHQLFEPLEVAQEPIPVPDLMELSSSFENQNKFGEIHPQELIDEDGDDFGDFEEATPELESIQEQKVPKIVPKVLPLDMERFKAMSTEQPSPTDPFNLDPFAIPMSSDPALSKIVSSDFDLLAGLDFGSCQAPPATLDVPTMDDTIMQVLSLDLPDIQDIPPVQLPLEGIQESQMEPDLELPGSPESDPLPSWDVITRDEAPSISLEDSANQDDLAIEPVLELAVEPQIPAPEKKPAKISVIHQAQLIWRSLLDECLKVIRITHDVFVGAESEVLSEILQSKQGQNYLANVCSTYLASYRFVTASRNFGYSITSEMKEIDSLWATLANVVQQNSTSLELPFAKVRPITRDCKICLHKCSEDYHVICRALFDHHIREDLPDFRLAS